MSNIDKPLSQINKNEFFLDNVTGDIYAVYHDP